MNLRKMRNEKAFHRAEKPLDHDEKSDGQSPLTECGSPDPLLGNAEMACPPASADPSHDCADFPLNQFLSPCILITGYGRQRANCYLE